MSDRLMLPPKARGLRKGRTGILTVMGLRGAA